MINNEVVNDFANIIGNIRIAISLDSFKKYATKYEEVLEELLKWVDSYYKTGNLNIVTPEKSLKIHEELDEIKWEILPDKNTGYESLLADAILVRYEVIIKIINKERENENGKR